ncbi:hypothetical protein M407DRAFT_28650 [Tulasnella calospora MUT 4182]|uniref:Uncharacterized protein n=1 Tax=Tulasnella calospora MUT 4182 TaxID=1051891 RepID=A0A0C3QBM5_9AGAM|nr:hypothetical protein M407DRAFT_28650 [Tulasnella calospora MUT 4182]
MQEQVSKLLEPFQDWRRPKPPFLPRASTNDHDPDGGNALDRQQGDEEVAVDKTNTKLSARERLDRLSGLRTKSNAITVTPSGGLKGGGKAEVVQATFKRHIWSRKQEVAVKKLRYYRDMDSHMFANVRMSLVPAVRRHLPPNP